MSGDITPNLLMEHDMTELTTLNSTNFADRAKAAGMDLSMPAVETKSSSLRRLGLQQKAIVGKQDIKGKKVNVEIVEGGSIKLEDPATRETVYAQSASLRPYLQRVMYKRFVRGSGDEPNKFIKTGMANDLNGDLKDTEGGFNCGKPAGYIKDWDQVPDSMKSLIKQIKRTRAILGTVTLEGVVNKDGEPVDLEPDIPIIWEIDNRDAFKDSSIPFRTLFSKKELPLHRRIDVGATQRDLPNGEFFYLPKLTLDMSSKLEITDEDQQTFADFIEWVNNYNTYVERQWSEKALKEDVTAGQSALLDGFLNVEEAAA